MKTLLAVAAVSAALLPGPRPDAFAQISSATVITEESELLPGPASEGRLGDLLLRNDRVAFVIESVDHVTGDALSGGHLLDAAALPDPSDRLDHLVLALVSWPRQADYGSVVVEDSGAGGTAVVRADGFDSSDPSVEIVTRYSLAPHAPSLEIETTITNHGATGVEGYRAGDAIDWSYGDNFAAGYGFNVSGVATFSEWIGCHHASTSYAYGKPSGTLQAEHGHTWSDSWLLSGSIAPGGSVSIVRHLAPGARGLSSASDAILETQGVPTGDVAGRVQDAVSGLGLDSAPLDCRVNGVAPYTFCVAGSSGHYEASLPPADFSLEASYDGYYTETSMISIAAGGTTRVDFPLMPVEYDAGRGDTLTVVMRPIITVPEIVVDGESFAIEALAPSATAGWSAKLASGRTTHELSVTTAAYDESRERWFLIAEVPEGVPEEMYDLIVEASGGVADTAAHSVAVRDTIPEEFYFAHITDTHLPNHIFYGDPGWDTDTTEIDDFRAVIEDLNLANPAFVLFTGDIVNEGEAEDFMGQRAFTKAQRLMAELDMPVFAVAGNHDVGGWDGMPPPDGTSRIEWWRFFGWRYLAAPPQGEEIYTQNYSFDYGGVHFVGLESYANYDGWRFPIYGWESFTARQMQWLAQDLSLVDEGTPKILFYHYDFDHELDFGALGIDGALWGHIHSSFGSIGARPFNIATENVCDGDRAMRFVRVSDGEVSPSQPVKAGPNGSRLRVAYDVPNDGTNYRMTASVTNENQERFDDALLRFEVPADSIPYRSDVGRIAQTLLDGDVATCYVHFEIPASGTTHVSVFPSGEIPGPQGGAQIHLAQSHPNPARVAASLSFFLDEAANAKLGVYDVAGRLVRTLHDGHAVEGENHAAWNLRDESGEEVATGVYFCLLESGGRSATRKIVVVR